MKSQNLAKYAKYDTVLDHHFVYALICCNLLGNLLIKMQPFYVYSVFQMLN